MANKLGEILDIEAKDSYIKRPASPMVTMELQDISRLAGFIRIPSMLEGVGITNIIRQKILYSGLPNQCRKCRKFEHHAKACNTNLVRPQEGSAHHNTPLRASSRGASDLSEATQKSAITVKLRVRVSPKPQETKGGKLREEAPEAMSPPQILSQSSGQGNLGLESLVQVANTRNSECSEEDHTMLEQSSLLATKPESPSKDIRRQQENLHKNKVKPNFGFQTPARPLDRHSGSNTNPFAALKKDNPEAKEEKDNLEEMRAGWTFQGKKKHTPRIAFPRPALLQSPSSTPSLEITPGGRRKRAHSDVHCSYFTSLGISTSPGQEHAKAMIWPVLSREKSE